MSSDTMDLESPLEIDGRITSVTLLDKDNNPNRVVEGDEGFKVRVRWHVEGTMLPYLGGQWTVKCFVESIGKGFEGLIGTAAQQVTGANDYEATIDVGPNQLPPPPGDDTVYELVALVSHSNHHKKTEIAGFGVGHYFEVRNP